MKPPESFSPKDKEDDESSNIRLNRRNQNRYIVKEFADCVNCKKDVLSSCINLMAELENTDTDIPQLKIYVQEISDICDDPVDQDKTEGTGEIEEIKEPESVEPTSLAELVTYAANTARAGTDSKITDVEFAIARLGFDSVKKNIN
jgi:hypothetical protein